MDDPRTFFDDLPFWTFVQSKLVSGNWTVEGVHLDGRYVARTGADLQALLVQCAADAKGLPEKMPYTLTWTDDDGTKKVKTHESLEEAITDAISRKSPKLTDESTGQVYGKEAIEGMHKEITNRHPERR